MKEFKSGFVALVGRSNVGKSTLLNVLLNQKVSIISNKAQTTRNTIRGIYNSDEEQIIFIDTPGIHKPKNKLSEYMVNIAQKSMEDVDLILYLIDDIKIGKGDEFILEKLKELNTKIFVVINKIDTMKQEDINQFILQLQKYDFIQNIFPISAINAVNTKELLNAIKKEMPQGVMYFPSDMTVDYAERFYVSEVIREKLLLYLNDEVPHGVAVVIDSYKERKNKPILDINVTIICEKSSHKAIIIGKDGRKLKGIAKASREELEEFLGIKINLQVWIKIKENWRDNQSLMLNYGYGEEI